MLHMTREMHSAGDGDIARPHRMPPFPHTGRESLHAVVSAVRAGRDAVRARLGSTNARAWRSPYLAGWDDALLALELAAVDASAVLADRTASQ